MRRSITRCHKPRDKKVRKYEQKSESEKQIQAQISNMTTLH